MRVYPLNSSPCSPLQQRNQQNRLGKLTPEAGCTLYLVMSWHSAYERLFYITWLRRLAFSFFPATNQDYL